MKIVLATRNPDKVRELSAMLADLPVELLPLDAVSSPPLVVEDQPTLHGNARKKAWALHQHTRLPALADDTALEVDALDGAPGVHSARFAGEDASDALNRALLLRRMAAATERTARFRTVIALADAGAVLFFEGTCEGTIVEKQRGRGGFGYDSLFQPEGCGRTFAEMSSVEKNRISHRARALRRISAYLLTHLGPTAV